MLLFAAKAREVRAGRSGSRPWRLAGVRASVHQRVCNQRAGGRLSAVMSATSYRRLSTPTCSLAQSLRRTARPKASGTRQRGSTYAVGVGGAVIGRGADIFLIDDPMPPWRMPSRKRPVRTSMVVHRHCLQPSSARRRYRADQPSDARGRPDRIAVGTSCCGRRRVGCVVEMPAIDENGGAFGQTPIPSRFWIISGATRYRGSGLRSISRTRFRMTATTSRRTGSVVHGSPEAPADLRRI